MPEMDGVSLLRVVAAEYADTVRLVYSAHIDSFCEEAIAELSFAALAKPAHPQKLMGMLERGVSVARPAFFELRRG
jgi:DNA-binding NtrC family response regulator